MCIRDSREGNGTAPAPQAAPAGGGSTDSPRQDSPTMQPVMRVNVPSSEDLWQSWWPPLYFSFDARGGMLFQGFVRPELHPDSRASPGDCITHIGSSALIDVDPSEALALLAGQECTSLELALQDPTGEVHAIHTSRSVHGRPVQGPAAVRGLDNPGNLCFLNAPMQCIAHTFPTMISFSGSAQAPPEHSALAMAQLHRIAASFAELAAAITVLDNKQRPVSTTSFRRALAPLVEEVMEPSAKIKQEQEDAHQLLLRLLDVIDSALLLHNAPPPLLDAKRKATEAEANLKLRRAQMNHVPSYEPAVKTLCELAWERDMQGRPGVVQRMMWGQYVKGIGCFNCHRWVEVRPEVYNMLELPIPASHGPNPASVKLSKCLELFFDQESSKNDQANLIKCPSCKKAGEVSQKYALMRIPSHLVLVLKRYTFSSLRGEYRITKSQTPVDPPEVIDMREHIFNSGDNMNEAGGGTQYELGSVCVHLGNTPRAGHYVALVKLQDVWYRVSDENVRECQQQDWEEAKRNSYILFYKQRI
eukprot:TRINITY_DN13499_c0_g2_i1.p1 TRINITY_DN13499_c0_g2~~TRINITY_DN13499_c0_g2_i1.p1  ORF type:complete len:531 (+),score=146.87 TRINITY_DN13499_c0_g2_i1:136-1728(+)